MKENWVYVNGVFCLEKEAVIPLTDRGFLFGDGVFTTLRVHEGKKELYECHLKRLEMSAQFLKLKGEPLIDEKKINELIHRSEAQKGTWRLKIAITAKEEENERSFGSVVVFLQSYLKRSTGPCSLCLFPHSMERPSASIKSLSYLDHLMVRRFAQERGCTDAITSTGKGYLLETGCSNLFWIDQGKCFVPDPQLPYLQGVFLQALLLKLPLPVEYVRATFEQLPPTANVYMCNALTHVRPIDRIVSHNPFLIREFSLSCQWQEMLDKATLKAIE